MSRSDDGERGDWSYIASFGFACALLAALVLAVDAEAIAYGRARLWAAVTTAARAGARCLAPSPAPTAAQPTQACVDQTVVDLVDENLSAASLSPISVAGSLSPNDTVVVQATAALYLPFAVPGLPEPVPLAAKATVALVPSASSAP